MSNKSIGELFDRGVEAYTWYATGRSSSRRGVARAACSPVRTPHGNESAAVRLLASLATCNLASHTDADVAFEPFAPIGGPELVEPFRNRVFLCGRDKRGRSGDLVDDEMSRVSASAGLEQHFYSADHQPHRNALDRSAHRHRRENFRDRFGNDRRRRANKMEAALKPIHGARDTLSPRRSWGRDICKSTSTARQAARYGITVEDIQNEIEIALGRPSGDVHRGKARPHPRPHPLRPRQPRRRR